MIANVKGKVLCIEEDSLVLDMGNIGLTVMVPMSKLDPRPVIGSELFLYTHLQVREDAWTLYGFSDREQLMIFRQLLNVSGIGAKTALGVLDEVSAGNVIRAISAQDVRTFTNVSGIGKKTAERIILELKDKFKNYTFTDNNDETVTQAPAGNFDDSNKELLAALKQLGYSAAEARAFVMEAMTTAGENASVEQLLRAALKIAHNA